MLSTPRTLRLRECHIQCVLAHNSNRCHTDADCPTTIMRIRKAHIRFHFIIKYFLRRHLCKQPNLFTMIKRACSFILYNSIFGFTNNGISKFKCLLILHNLISVSDNTKYRIISITHICLIIRNQSSISSIYGSLFYFPVKTRKLKCFCTGGGLINFRPKTMPRLLTNIHHSFNISGHYFLPPLNNFVLFFTNYLRNKSFLYQSL